MERGQDAPTPAHPQSPKRIKARALVWSAVPVPGTLAPGAVTDNSAGVGIAGARGLIYDDPQLAVLSRGLWPRKPRRPGEMTGRRHAVLDDLSQRTDPSIWRSWSSSSMTSHGREVPVQRDCWTQRKSWRWKVSVTASKPGSWGGLPTRLARR